MEAVTIGEGPFSAMQLVKTKEHGEYLSSIIHRARDEVVGRCACIRLLGLLW